MTHHLRRDSKQFVEDNTKTFCGIKIIPLEGFHGLQLPTNMTFYLRATSQTKKQNKSKNQAKISISKRESYTKSLLQICDPLAKGM